MSKTTRKPTKEERALAQLHATALGHAWDDMREAACREYLDREQLPLLKAFSVAFMSMSAGYRRIANGSDIDL